MTVKASYGVARNRATTGLALTATGMVVVMLLTQLFGYEDFAIILSNLLATNDARLLSVTAGAIVLAELMGLPFLLKMYMSTLLRILSAAFGFSVAGFWLLVSLTNAHAANSDLFSTTVTLPGGLVAVLWAGILFACICRVIYADSRFRHAGS